ncbi:hypothetical protein PMAYCL1PPCAC_04126, partial [Pristionchus mayeri]
GGKLFCAHGGVSAGTMTRHELRLLRKPIMDVGKDQLLTDILWADPTRGTDGSVRARVYRSWYHAPTTTTVA